MGLPVANGPFPSPTQPNTSRGPKAVAVTGTFLFLSLALLALRLYVRLRITRFPGWDDLLVVIAAVSSSRLIEA